MIHLTDLVRGTRELCRVSWVRLGCLYRSIRFVLFRFYRFVFLYTNSFLLQLVYFIFVSTLGFWILKWMKPRTAGSFRPRNLDLLFTSVSAATVSSMTTVEMEVFSDAQLVVLTFLMFVGGEVFISMVGMHLKRRKLRMLLKPEEKVASVEIDLANRPESLTNVVERIELGLANKSHSFTPEDHEYWRCLSFKFLASAVLVYLGVVQLLGVSMVSVYLRVVSSARNVLRDKGLNAVTFSVFTVVSTFSGCGFLPTNENMIVFSKNSGLLLILILQSLLGNTLFPSCLRFCLWVFNKFTNSVDTSFLLKNTSEARYLHLLPKLHSQLLVATVFSFIGVQFVLFCAMQWDSEVLAGLSPVEKVAGILFQCVNTRHTGESIVDLSKIAPAILVLFVAMM